MNMHHRSTVLIRLLILLLVISSFGASLHLARASSDVAPDFFVTTTGSGSACAQAAPCDLATAVSLAGEGANIYVAAGTYTSSGAEVIRLVYSVNLYGGWDGAASGPIVRDPQVHVSVLDGQDARRVIYVVGEQPLIDGFTITRGYAINNGGGIYVFDGLPSFRNNLITDNWGTTYGGALYTAGGGANVENNRIIANETEYGGTLIFGSGTQGEVHGNLFADNLADYGSAVHIDKASLSFTHNILRTNTGSVVEINRGTGVIVITNNLFYDNPSTSVRLQNESNANVFHNTFATSPNSALVINYNSSATFSNNIVTHCGGASLVKNDTSTISGTNNLFYWNGSNPNLLTNELVQDPQYIDEALDNYQLQRGSPAVDFGVDLGVLDDLLLVRRPIGLAPDLGAYERLIYIYLPLVMKP